VQPMLQWKTICIIYSECVFVALGIQHAIHVGHVFPVASPVPVYFYTLSIFEKKIY